MLGTKAQAIEQHARQAGFACLCFDQRGHGRCVAGWAALGGLSCCRLE
jgi:alpha-beta hydrolase superfamily lysophospholipase